MIEMDEEWCTTKAIVSVGPNDLEKVVAALSINEKKEFIIITPQKVVALVPREIPSRQKIVIKAAATQGMTRSDRCYTLEELAQEVQKKDQSKNPFSEAEVEEFWRKIQPKDYLIVKHLEKTPTHIFVWALLMSSQLHRHALMKALDDTYVPVSTDSDNLATMISQVIRGYRINFCDEELPFKGRMHNKVLHVTIKCRDKIVNHVLVDDGFDLNICPLFTLKQLNFDVGKVHQNKVNVRVFDGKQRNTLGAVNLVIEMGPAEFNVEFQVLNINTSYNLLLGRPFIHIARVVSSTFHQLMKFVWKDQELVIHGEMSHSDEYALIVDEVCRGCDFYTLKLINATGDDLAPQPHMPYVYKMIVIVMLQSDFKSDFRMGKHFQGIVEPIQISAIGVKFDLRYVPTDDDEADVMNKSDDRMLARPMPHLYQSFPMREYVKDDGLGEGIWGLFEEVNAIMEDEAKTSGICDAEPEK